MGRLLDHLMTKKLDRVWQKSGAKSSSVSSLNVTQTKPRGEKIDGNFKVN